MSRLIVWVARVLDWRSKQPAFIRWLAAAGLLAVPFACRTALGPLHGLNPGLSFYPMFLFAVVILDWKEAAAVMLLFIGFASYLFVRPDNFLMPVGWLVVGSLNIAIIAAMKSLTQELTAGNERQRLLFQELQHRVANSLQAASGTLSIARRRIESSPAQVAQLLDEGSQRLMAAADMHRRLNDPALFQDGLAPILRDAVCSVIDARQAALTFDIEKLDLGYDQMSLLTMLVIEIANNAQKHVFQHGLGTRFALTLKAVTNMRAALTVTDDGPGLAGPSPAVPEAQHLGAHIIRDLTAQVGGTTTVIPGRGTTILIEFPFAARPAPLRERSPGRPPRLATRLRHTQAL